MLNKSRGGSRKTDQEEQIKRLDQEELIKRNESEDQVKRNRLRGTD